MGILMMFDDLVLLIIRMVFCMFVVLSSIFLIIILFMWIILWVCIIGS